MSGALNDHRDGTTSLSLWGQIRESLVPLVTWWASHLLGVAMFALCVLIMEGPSMDNVLALLYLSAIMVGGGAAGQLLALARVRTWLALAGGGVLWGIGFALTLTAAVGGLGPVAGLIVGVLILGPAAVWGGMWSLETNRSLWATWTPLIWMTGAVFVWIDKTGKDAAWKAGDKLAVWDLVTIPALALSLLTILVYLVSRETHRLALWRRGREAPLPPAVPDRGAARPRMTLLGVLAMLAVTAALTVGTAAISPFLWRTGAPGEGDGDPQEPTQQQEPQEPQEPQEGDGEWLKGMQEMVEKMVEAGEQASQAGCAATSIFVLAALMWAVGWRPARRLFVLRHLREPLWTVSPTERIDQGWRLVEIALGDMGIHPMPGEDAAGLARRAEEVLRAHSPVEVHGLAEAAAAADRVRFGLGVRPGDVATMERFSVWAMDTIWERLSEREQLRAMYRPIR